MSEQVERRANPVSPTSLGRSSQAASDFGLRSGKVHLYDYVRVVYKHRWPAVTALALVCGLSLLYNLTRVPTYEAHVQLLIDAGTENVVNFKAVVEQDKAQSDYYQTQYRLLKSRALAHQTLEALNAWQAPELVGGGPPPSALARFADALFNPVATMRGLIPHRRPLTSAAPAAGDAQSPVIDEFLGRLTVTPVGESRLVDAKFVARDPVFAAKAINGVADQYIQQSRDFKFQASTEAIDWLKDKLQEQKTTVETSEMAAQRYREQNAPIPAEDKQNIVVQKLDDLNAAVTRAKIARIAKESQYHQLEGLRGHASTLEELPSVVANPVVQDLKKQLSDLQRQKAQLSEKLGDKHPEIAKLTAAIETTQAHLNTEVDKVIAGVQNEFQASAAEEQNLSAALEAQKKEALSLSRLSINYGVLERDAASNHQIFDSLLQRTKEAGISGGLKTSDIRIIDRAEVPRSPSTQTGGNLIMSFLFGSMLSIGLAFFLEYLDSSLKSPEEIRDHLHLPFLGMLPVFAADAPLDLPLLTGGVPVHFSEAFQSVRTNVLFSAVANGPKTLIVTSTQPNEGKSVVASNLAVSFGQVGMRVVLIDADMRRPSLHKAFTTDRGPGLAEVLAGSAPVSKAVRLTRAENVWLMPAGERPSNPAVLLESQRFRELIAGLGSRFDWVILDSPPVMPVTDAAIVASMVAGVVFVVGSEMTSRYAAMNALNQLEAAKAGFVGAVLNRVNVVKHRYYYSNYYKDKYSSYYREPASSESGVPVA